MSIVIMKSIFCLTFVLAIVSGALLPRKLEEVTLKHSAFLQIFKDKTKSQGEFDPDQFTLLISTFDPYSFQVDAKYFLRGPGKYLTNESALSDAITLLDKTAFWPNDPDFVEEEVFGFEAVAWPSGFLVPGKTKGKIEIYNLANLNTEPSVNIASLDNSDWYYHRTIWKDINEDGHVDAISARFQFPSLGSPARSELMWFQNPGQLEEGWTQHTLVTNGPDVHFRHLEITNEIEGVTFDCVYAAEFWNEQLILYCVVSVPGAWNNASNIMKIPVDLQAGQAFDCLVADVNNDGRLDLLATVYNTTSNEGFVNVYQVPENFPNGPFTKHVIASGFVAGVIVGGDSMSPGSAKLFHRHVSEVGSKASIMLSGDDDGCHYILTPVSEEVEDWNYSKNMLVNTTGTTSGKFAVEDLDGDGWTEIIAAGYTTGTLYLYSFAPM